jgi:uncharacterized protein (DUF1810 family)
MTSDPFNLVRFLEPQDRAWNAITAELRTGRKATHWMWFVFPQMRGLGRSAMAEHFGLSGLDEARAYLAHPVLGSRLEECTRLALAAAPRSAGDIFGYPDTVKFQSSMTLFALAAGEDSVFAETLAVFFDGEKDVATLRLVACA